MSQLFPALGPYFWWIVAALLLLAEMMAPGFFMIWLAVAAGLTALVHVVAPMAWESEVLVFAMLALLAVAASWRVVRRSWAVKSDQPHLNQRSAALVGRSFILPQPIVNGSGKISYQDTLWDVDGPDLPTGARVRVTAVEGLRLRVKVGE